MNVRVDLGARGYDIVIGNKSLPQLGDFVRSVVQGPCAYVISDQNVSTHAEKVAAILEQSGYHPCLCTVPPGEAQKSWTSAQTLYDFLGQANADRKSLIVAVGGGVVGDLAGFVAATYLRGLALFMVPTTLLAMVDSSVGGKVGINHSRGKNLIGAFHQPVGVWIDTDLLATLPEREYKSGLAEVVKYGVILDAEFFEYLERHIPDLLQRAPEAVMHIVARSCRLKADVVQKDEREETGLRMILNYGHTFAHAIENVAGYGSWLHGEAVAAGMTCASRLAELRGMISSEVSGRQRSLLQAFGLPASSLQADPEQMIVAMRTDKKARAGRWRFVLPQKLGEVTLVDDVTEAEVRKVLAECKG
jgi:3-dehydroquinate synthase